MQLVCLRCRATGDVEMDGRNPGSGFVLKCQRCGQPNRFLAPAPEEEDLPQRGQYPVRRQPQGTFDGVPRRPRGTPPNAHVPGAPWAQGLENHDFAVLDGSNLAHLQRLAGNPTLAPIHDAVETLQDAGFETHVWVDSSLWWQLHDDEARAELNRLLDDGGWSQSPKGVKADLPLLEEADERHGIVVSDDDFRQYQEHYPWLIHERHRKIRVFYTTSGEQHLIQDQVRPPRPKAEVLDQDAMDELLLRVHKATADGFALRVAMAEELRRLLPGFKSKQYGHKSFTEFLMAQDHLFRFEELRRDGQDRVYQIRVWLR